MTTYPNRSATESTPSCASLAHELKTLHPAPFSLIINFGPIHIGINCNSENLAESLSRYYREFLSINSDTAPDIVIHALEAPIEADTFPFPFSPDCSRGGAFPVKEEFADFPDGRIVRKISTGMTFVISDRDNIAIGQCFLNHQQIVNFINNRFINWQLNQNGLLAHAAGVCAAGVGIALAGHSGSGKSTLALRLLSHGAHFISNDRLVILLSQQTPMMHGVVKHPRVNPGTLMNNPLLNHIIPPNQRVGFESLSDDQLWHVEQKYDVFIDAIFGPGRFLLQSPLHAVFLLNWKHGGGALRVSQPNISLRPGLITLIRKSPGIFHRPNPSANLDFSSLQYTRILQKCDVYEFTGGIDFNAAADFILRIRVPESIKLQD